MADKIDWKKKVAESNGEMIFLPDSFTGAAEDIEKSRKEFNEMILKVAEKEIALNMATQTMFYDLRKHLAKNGVSDVWTKQLGFNAQALKEGKFVVNVLENQR